MHRIFVKFLWRFGLSCDLVIWTNLAMLYFTTEFITGFNFILLGYPFICFVSLLCYLFTKLIRFDQLLHGVRGTFVTRTCLFTQVKLFFIYCLLILFFFRGTSCVLFFTSLLVTPFTYKIIFFIGFIAYVTIYLTIFGVDMRIKHLCLNIIIALLLMFFLILLWCVNNYFALLILLDILNLLMLLLLVLDLRPESWIELERTTLRNLMGLSIFFWTSFIATVILFMGGLVILQNFMTVDLNMLIICCGMMNYNITISTIPTKLYFIIFILCLFLKAGIGPFFIWKRYAFAILRTSSLFIYLLEYFSTMFIYILYLLMVYINISTLALLMLFFSFTVLTLLWIMSLLEFGTRLGDFFIFSTVFNTAFVLGLFCLILYI